MEHARVAVFVMGVSGSGKTTLASALAQQLGVPFLEGDDFHSAEAKEKMRSGVPLTDADRLPWIERINARVRELVEAGTGCVVACSALKATYRQWLTEGLLESQYVFVLLRGDPAIIAQRMQHREHYMPPSLLASQLATLEPPPADAPRVLVLDVALEPHEQQARALQWLASVGARAQ